MITEENFLEFKCPFCHAQNAFPESSEGRVQECFNCLESLIVPAPGVETGLRIPFPLTTPRLILRPFKADDWENFLALAGEEQFLEFTDHLSFPKEDLSSREQAVVSWLERVGAIKLTTPNSLFHLAIELKATAKLAGFVQVFFTDSERQQAQIYLNMHRDFQRQGFGLEAARGVTKFFFEDLRLHRVTASCEGQNKAGCSFFAKLGMRKEGEFLKDHLINGEWCDRVYFGLLAEECRDVEDSGGNA